MLTAGEVKLLIKGIENLEKLNLGRFCKRSVL
jgi:hypothetical protein